MINVLHVEEKLVPNDGKMYEVVQICLVDFVYIRLCPFLIVGKV